MKFLFRFILLALVFHTAWGFSSGERPAVFPYTSNPMSLSESVKWHDILNLTSNAFYSWKNDRLLINLETLWKKNAVQSGQFPWGSSLVIFILGTLWLFASLRREGGVTTALLNSGALAVSLLLVLGFDQAIWSSLVFLPWFILFLRRLLSDRRDWLPFSIICLFLSMRLAASANQLAGLLFLLSLGICFALARDIRNREETPLPWFSALLMFAICVWPLFSAQVPVFPDYPAHARIVPFSGVADFVRPLVGPETPLPLINREALRLSLGGLSLVVFAVSWILLLLTGRSSSRRTSRICLAAASLLALFASLDTVLPEHLSQIMPLAALSRTVPGLFFIPLAPFFSALGIFFLACALHAARSDFLMALLTGVAVFASPLATYSNQDPQPLCSAPELLSQQFQQADEFKHRDKAACPAELLKVLISPSSQIVRNEGAWIIARRSHLQSLRTRGLKRLTVELAASSNSDKQALQQVFDGKPDTRWSPKKGRQEGGNSEWLAFRLEKPVLTSGLEISPGSFRTDFPRGLRIMVASECAALPEKEEGLTSVFDQLPWQGEIKFTSSGYPYYGGQSEVRAYFREDTNVQCIKIFQTGQTPNFDWSVSRVRLLVPDPPRTPDEEMPQ